MIRQVGKLSVTMCVNWNMKSAIRNSVWMALTMALHNSETNQLPSRSLIPLIILYHHLLVGPCSACVLLAVFPQRKWYISVAVVRYNHVLVGSSPIIKKINYTLITLNMKIVLNKCGFVSRFGTLNAHGSLFLLIFLPHAALMC